MDKVDREPGEEPMRALAEQNRPGNGLPSSHSLGSAKRRPHFGQKFAKTLKTYNFVQPKSESIPTEKD